MHVWSRCITVVYGTNRYDSQVILSIEYRHADLKDKYPNFEVGLKCIIMVF